MASHELACTAFVSCPARPSLSFHIVTLLNATYSSLSEMGCFGGWPSFGFAWAMEHAIPSFEQYGYTGINLDCRWGTGSQPLADMPADIS